MNKKEIATLFLQAQKHKDRGVYDKALANLQRIVAEVPDDVRYVYLLASTYLELHDTDAATQYTNQALAIQPDYVEAIELQGLIAEAQKKYNDAEKYYLKCIELDKDFIHARFLLIELYSNLCYFNPYEELKPIVFDEPEKVVYHADILLASFDPEKIKKMTSSKRNRTHIIYGFTSRLHSIALYKLKRYEDCIRSLEYALELMEIFTAISKRKREAFMGLMEEANILKLYHILGNRPKVEEYIEKLRFHHIEEREFEEMIQTFIEEAERGEIYI